MTRLNKIAGILEFLMNLFILSMLSFITPITPIIENINYFDSILNKYIPEKTMIGYSTTTESIRIILIYLLILVFCLNIILVIFTKKNIIELCLNLESNKSRIDILAREIFKWTTLIIITFLLRDVEFNQTIFVIVAIRFIPLLLFIFDIYYRFKHNGNSSIFNSILGIEYYKKGA